MKRILIATVAVLGFAGIAAAQEAPVLTGNYSANVLNAYNGTADAGADFAGQAAIGGSRVVVPADAATPDGNVATIWNQNYSGK